MPDPLSMALVPPSLREALESPVILDAFPGLTWRTCGDLALTIAVSIPVTEQHHRTRRIGVAPELAGLTVQQLCQLLALYFPEPVDPRSLLALISDRAGHLWLLWWQARRDPHDTEGNQLAEQTWQELQTAISGLHSALAELLPEDA